MVHFDYIAVIATHVIIADIVMENYTVIHGTFRMIHINTKTTVITS